MTGPAAALPAGLDAAGQMAADLALVDAVGGGAAPLLRTYTWTRPALSLGRFQPETDVDTAACTARGVEVVRRPTGGRALLHGADVTYAIALPRPAGAAGTVDALYCFLAQGLIAGLRILGVEASVAASDGDQGEACFASMRGSDIRVGGRKLCGSAQVHRGGVVLQHGSVLVDRLAFDETDVLHYPSVPARLREQERLRATTVTLRDLGVTQSGAEVAAALVEGFTAVLDIGLRVAGPVQASVA